MMEAVFHPIHTGGWVSWVLFLMAGFLWYSMGYQALILHYSQPRGRGLTLKLSQWQGALKQHQQFLRSLVIVAPLLGLLGTVIGMIETFSSLETTALHTQGGGIAAGISQALITTQMGLLVAIPGLLGSRQLNKKAESLLLEKTAPTFDGAQSNSTNNHGDKGG